MKKGVVISFLLLLFLCYSCLLRRKGREALTTLANTERPATDTIYIVPGYFPETGNADSGLYYLLQGDAFSSGVPYSLYKTFYPLRKTSLGSLTGFDRNALNDMVVYQNKNGSSE